MSVTVRVKFPDDRKTSETEVRHEAAPAVTLRQGIGCALAMAASSKLQLLFCTLSVTKIFSLPLAGFFLGVAAFRMHLMLMQYSIAAIAIFFAWSAIKWDAP